MGKFIDKKGAVRVVLKQLQLSRLNKSGRVSTLGFSTRNNYPKMITYINNGDKSVVGADNNIQASFTYINFNLLIGYLTAVIDAEAGTKFEIKTYNTKYVDGNKTDDIEVECTIILGKDENGIIYIMMIDKDDTKPKMRFNLLADEKWIKIFQDGVDVTVKAMASKLFAKAYVATLTRAMATIYAHEDALAKLPEQN